MYYIYIIQIKSSSQQCHSYTLFQLISPKKNWCPLYSWKIRHSKNGHLATEKTKDQEGLLKYVIISKLANQETVFFNSKKW